MAVSTTLESQFVYRGVSLDDHQPDLRVSLSYDHASGAYAGLSGIAGATAHDGVRPLGVTAYLGFAHQAANGVTWDAGLTATDLVIFLKALPQLATNGVDAPRRYEPTYAEAYVGLSAGSLSGRLYISPDYLQQGVSSAYLDLNRSFTFTSRLNGYLHLGVLTPFGDSVNPYAERVRIDAGAGAGWSFRHAQLRIGWTSATPSVEYPPHYRQKANQLVVSATHFF